MEKHTDLLYQDFREDCTISLFKDGKVQVDLGAYGYIRNVLDDSQGTQSYNSEYVPTKLEKISMYLHLLYDAQKVDHSVHAEIDEALKQFKLEAGL